MSWIVSVLIAIELVLAVILSSDFGAPEAATFLFVLTTGLVGFLTAQRVRNNPIGWLLLSAALAFATGGLAVTVLEVPTIDPQGSIFMASAFVGNLAFGLGFGLITTYVLLIFPTGRLPSRRWRFLPWVAGIGLALLLSGIALAPFEDLPVDNPIGFQGSETVLQILESGGLLVLVPTIFASAGSMVVRFRRANRVERQQLKWMVLGVAVMVVALVAAAWANLSNDIENAITTTAAVLIPVAIGVAILRYRLYDIDRIISRTVTYGLVTAALLGIYVAIVFVLTDLIRLEGDLAVAGATLGVAALFSPLRRRLQSSIDRRFNRSGAAAARIVENFTRLLPSRVDLVELKREVRTVIGQTMQPAVFSLWLRRETD